MGEAKSAVLCPMTTRKLPHPPLDGISRVRFAPQARSSQLLVSSWDTHLRLYDVATGMLAGMHKSTLAVLDCTFLQDPTRAVSVGLDRRIVCWDFQSQQEQVLGHHESPVRCVEYDQSTRQIVTGSWDKSLRLWDERHSGPTKVVNTGTKVF